MIVMGIKAFGHDTGAAIVADNGSDLEIVAIAEARLNRIKHSWRYPFLSIDYCLSALGLKNLREVDAIYFDLHDSQNRRNLSKSLPSEYDKDCDTVPAFNQIIHSLLDFGKTKVQYCSHLAAHAASAYYLSPFSEATVLVVDGGLGVFSGRGNCLEIIDMNGYNESWVNGAPSELANISGTGPLYNFVTTKLGFSCFDAGKTMALASFSHEFDKKDIYPLPDNRHQDVLINYRPTIEWIRKNVPTFHQIVGAEQEDGLVSKFWVNLARQSQQVLEEDVLFIAESAIRKCKSKNLAYAGGVALSCITNRKIIDAGLVDNIFVQPASSDEGIALGCALFGYYLEGGKKRKVLDGCYLGKNYDTRNLSETLKNGNLNSKKSSNQEVAKLISEGNIVARYASKSEYGPRALGNRSILADPRRPEMTSILNSRVKHREGFRPFAPSVIETEANTYFEMPFPGPYMNIAAPVRPEFRKLIPAVTHVDGSCRPQTVTQSQNKDYYDLIDTFGEQTGVYCIINTSFNDNGEPIVETPEDALRSFRRTNIDYLFIDDQLVWRAEGVSVDRSIPLSDSVKDERFKDLLCQYCDVKLIHEVLTPLAFNNGDSILLMSQEMGLLENIK